MGKIKPSSSDICRRLPGEIIEEIVGNLFPKDRGINKYNGNSDDALESISETTKEELDTIIKKTIHKGKQAPGPDGLQAGLVTEAYRGAEALYRGLYDGCLRTGRFPERWKIARLVLIKKEGKPDGEASL